MGASAAAPAPSWRGPAATSLCQSSAGGYSCPPPAYAAPQVFEVELIDWKSVKDIAGALRALCGSALQRLHALRLAGGVARPAQWPSLLPLLEPAVVLRAPTQPVAALAAVPAGGGTAVPPRVRATRTPSAVHVTLLPPCCPALAPRAGDGGVIKTIVKEGSGWAKPLPRDEVRVRWVLPRPGLACPGASSLGCCAVPPNRWADACRPRRQIPCFDAHNQPVPAVTRLPFPPPGPRPSLQLLGAGAGRGAAFLHQPGGRRSVQPGAAALLPRHRHR